MRAYWSAVKAVEEGAPEILIECGEASFRRDDAALEFLIPARTRSPRGLTQKVEILQNMVETERAPAQIAALAASIADDALSMSRQYLSGAV